MSCDVLSQRRLEDWLKLTVPLVMQSRWFNSICRKVDPAVVESAVWMELHDFGSRPDSDLNARVEFGLIRRGVIDELRRFGYCQRSDRKDDGSDRKVQQRGKHVTKPGGICGDALFHSAAEGSAGWHSAKAREADVDRSVETEDDIQFAVRLGRLNREQANIVCLLITGCKPMQVARRMGITLARFTDQREKIAKKMSGVARWRLLEALKTYV